MSKLVSMEMTPAEAKADAPCAIEADRPKYPWGTCLNLDENTLAKLGVKELPTVGTEIPLTAIAKVTGTSEREYEGGTRKTLDLQITGMTLGDEDEGGTFEKTAERMYGKKG